MPISASLLLDDRLKEDVGVTSEDLYAELFATGKRGGLSFATTESPKEQADLSLYSFV